MGELRDGDVEELNGLAALVAVVEDNPEGRAAELEELFGDRYGRAAVLVAGRADEPVDVEPYGRAEDELLL